MITIDNDYGIDNITMEKHLILFCPMGRDHYDADVDIDIVPASKIMDYCETDSFLKGLNGQRLTIEEAVQAIYRYINGGISPKGLSVDLRASNGAHMPVTVSKRGGCLS